MALIYEPKGQAREYAALACNIYSGCDHRCVYCYAPSATRKQREEFARPKPRNSFIEILDRECMARKRAGTNSGRVLLCFTCDPYQHLDERLGLTRDTIRLLHRYGFTVQVLTKGGSRAMRDLDLFGPGDAFASTLTLLDDTSSRKWEPGAALPDDRIETLRQFHAAGVPTWVSLEPVLNPASALEIIRRTHGFVDLYKVGKLNYHELASRIDWQVFADDVVSLCESLQNPYLIKDSLRPYLRDGARRPYQTTVAELEQRGWVQSQRPCTGEPGAHTQPQSRQSPQTDRQPRLL